MHGPYTKVLKSQGTAVQPSAFAISGLMSKVRDVTTPETDHTVLAAGIKGRFNDLYRMADVLDAKGVTAGVAAKGEMPAVLNTFGGVNSYMDKPWWGTQRGKIDRKAIQRMGESANNPAAAYNTPDLTPEEYAGVFDDGVWDGADPDSMPFDTAYMKANRDLDVVPGETIKTDTTMIASPAQIGLSSKYYEDMTFSGGNQGKFSNYGSDRTPAKTGTQGQSETFSSTAGGGVLTSKGGVVWPVPKRWVDTITSGFGDRVHPILHTKKFHPGVDFGLAYNTPCYSILDGVVDTAGWVRGYGNTAVIKHNYNGIILFSLYGHGATDPRTRPGISVGQSVKAGDIVLYGDSTGMSTGNHLHFGIYRNRMVYANSDAISPLPFLKGGQVK